MNPSYDPNKIMIPCNAQCTVPDHHSMCPIAQIKHICQTEKLTHTLDTLLHKYQKDSINPMQDIIASKNHIINKLECEIFFLKDQLCLLNVQYNEKLDYMREEHNKELLLYKKKIYCE